MPVSVSYTGTAPDIGALNLDNPDNIINGNGLSEPITDANLQTVTHAAVNFDPPGIAWTTTDPGGPNSDFFAVSTGTVVFEFDLGSATTVGTFASWGYHFGTFNDNSIANVTLEFSVDGGATVDSVQTIDVPYTTSWDLASVVPLTPASADYITMTVNDNHFGSVYANGGDRVGVAEIVFSTEVIPEPTTLSLMVLFGGLALFRRRNQAV